MEAGSLSGTRGAYRLVTAVEALEIPATVQVVLSARIDRLPEREKQVLQTAAVIGKQFSEPILKQVVELPDRDLAGSLSALQGAEFVYQVALYPVAEYAFKHPLTQEVSYGAQLGDRRAHVHARIARALEELRSDALEENAALIAHHLQQAGQALEAARWHARAAQWAAMNYASEATRHWLEVRRLLKEIDASPETLELRVQAAEQLLDLGHRAGLPEAEADAIFAEGIGLAREQDNPHALATLEGNYGHLKGFYNRFDQSIDHVRRALEIARRFDDPVLEGRLQVAHARALLWTGRFREGERVIDVALERLGECPSVGADRNKLETYLWLLLFRAHFLTFTDRPDEGSKVFERGIQYARDAGEAYMEAIFCGDAVAAYSFLGNPARALDLSRRSVEIAEKLKGSWLLVLSSFQLGHAHVENADWAEATVALEQSRSVMHETGIGLEWEGVVLSWLSEAYLGLEDHAKAREAADRALDFVQRFPDAKANGIFVRLALAKNLLAARDGVSREAVEQELQTLAALLEETGAAVFLPRVHEARGELAHLLGDDATHQRELREAHRLYTEMGATGHAKRLAGELAELEVSP